MTDIIDGEFEVIEEETLGIIPEDHPKYRTWVYNRIDGEMQSKIVTAKEAEELFEDGWRMTPAAFTEEEHLKDVPEFEALADDMAQTMNFLLNLDHCEDKTALVEFAQDFLKIHVKPTWKLETIKKRVIKKATELGLMEDGDSI